MSAGEVGPPETGSLRVAFVQVGGRKVRAEQFASVQPGLAQARSREPGPAQIRVPEVGAAQVRPGKIASGEIQPAKVLSCQVDPAQVHAAGPVAVHRLTLLAGRREERPRILQPGPAVRRVVPHFEDAQRAALDGPPDGRGVNGGEEPTYVKRS